MQNLEKQKIFCLCICTVTKDRIEDKWENCQPVIVYIVLDCINYSSPVQLAMHQFDRVMKPDRASTNILSGQDVSVHAMQTLTAFT